MFSFISSRRRDSLTSVPVALEAFTLFCCSYGRLIEDCIQGDQTLFTRSDAVDASWRFFNPVLKYWQEHPDAPLYGYPVGTWGPLESEAMMREHGAEWTNPCKNLTNTDEYCEL